jgi:hypothetical protein
MRNPQHRRPFRVVDTDARTPAPLPPAVLPVGAVELAAAGDTLMRAALELVRAIERRDFDHVGPDASPELQAVLAARRAWVKVTTRWERHK